MCVLRIPEIMSILNILFKECIRDIIMTITINITMIIEHTQLVVAKFLERPG